MLTVAVIVSYVAAVALLGALGFAGARRWRLAVTLSSSATLASVGVLIFLFGRFVAASGSTDVTTKALALTVTLSELMNCGVIPLLVAVAGALLGAAARKRLGPPT